MGEHVRRGRRVTQRVLPLASLGEKPADAIRRNVIQCRVATGRGVERERAEFAMPFEVLDKAGVNSRREFRDTGNPAADNLFSGPANQRVCM